MLGSQHLPLTVEQTAAALQAAQAAGAGHGGFGGGQVRAVRQRVQAGLGLEGRCVVLEVQQLLFAGMRSLGTSSSGW